MSAIEESIEVSSPLRTVYDQWTQFEQFPEFMEGVTEVRQLDETHLHWVAEFAGHRHEWDAEVTEQKPDERVAWKNVDGTDNAGVVTFHRLGEDTTKVMVQMDFVPEGIVEKIGSALGAPDRRVQGDLRRFKEMVEHGGGQPAGWRGEVKRPDEADHPDTPTTRGDSPTNGDSSTDVKTPFSPHKDDDSPLGDSDQHSTA